MVEGKEGDLFIQVGKQTKAGKPVAREAKAIADIERAGKNVISFP